MTMKENRTTSITPLQAYADAGRYAAWSYFLRAYKRVLSQLEADLAVVNIESAAQYEVLARIYHSPEGRVQFVELSKSLFLSQSRITRLIKRLEKEGLVLAEKSVAEGHWAMFASLSQEGRQLYEDGVPVLLKSFGAYFARHVGDEDVAALVRVLRALAEPLP